MIRKYDTKVNKFLLCPTISYTTNKDYLNNFQLNYKEFVELNSYPEKKEDKTLIKYYAELEKTIKKPVSNIPSIKNYIWTRNHIKKYLKDKKDAYIWILRVYKLNKPYWAEITRGALVHANLKHEVKLEGIKPVINDEKFIKYKKKL